jgi:hypothetical protein
MKPKEGDQPQRPQKLVVGSGITNQISGNGKKQL